MFINNTKNYNLRSNTQFKIVVPKSVRYGTETFSYIGPKILELIPNDLPTLKILKKTSKPGFQINVLVDYANHINVFFVTIDNNCSITTIEHYLFVFLYCFILLCSYALSIDRLKVGNLEG